MKRLLALIVIGLGMASGAARSDVPPARPAAPPAPPPAAPKAAAPAVPPPGPASPIQKKLEEALDRMDKKDDVGAIRILEGLKQDPSVTPPVLSLLGGLYLKTNRAKEAMAILKPLADAADADPAVLFNA